MRSLMQMIAIARSPSLELAQIKTPMATGKPSPPTSLTSNLGRLRYTLSEALAAALQTCPIRPILQTTASQERVAAQPRTVTQSGPGLESFRRFAIGGILCMVENRQTSSGPRMVSEPPALISLFGFLRCRRGLQLQFADSPALSAMKAAGHVGVSV